MSPLPFSSLSPRAEAAEEEEAEALRLCWWAAAVDTGGVDDDDEDPTPAGEKRGDGGAGWADECSPRDSEERDV